MKWILVLLAGVLLVSGCTQPEYIGPGLAPGEPAKTACIRLCEGNLKAEKDLSNGPCLSDDNPGWKIDDWVCDVAHDPREPVDNLPENQCQAFRSGEARHFVEVDPDCEFIKAV